VVRVTTNEIGAQVTAVCEGLSLDQEAGFFQGSGHILFGLEKIGECIDTACSDLFTQDVDVGPQALLDVCAVDIPQHSHDVARNCRRLRVERIDRGRLFLILSGADSFTRDLSFEQLQALDHCPAVVIGGFPDMRLASACLTVRRDKFVPLAVTPVNQVLFDEFQRFVEDLQVL
jgi:hypothetical protein